MALKMYVFRVFIFTTVKIIVYLSTYETHQEAPVYLWVIYIHTVGNQMATLYEFEIEFIKDDRLNFLT